MAIEEEASLAKQKREAIFAIILLLLVSAAGIFIVLWGSFELSKNGYTLIELISLLICVGAIGGCLVRAISISTRLRADRG